VDFVSTVGNKNGFVLMFSRERPIYQPGRRPIFGFCRYIGISQNGQFYWPQ